MGKVFLMCAGNPEVTEISGDIPTVKLFEAEVLNKLATKMSLPAYITPMYVMHEPNGLEVAKTEWEKFLAQ